MLRAESTDGCATSSINDEFKPPEHMSEMLYAISQEYERSRSTNDADNDNNNNQDDQENNNNDQDDEEEEGMENARSASETFHYSISTSQSKNNNNNNNTNNTASAAIGTFSKTIQHQEYNDEDEDDDDDTSGNDDELQVDLFRLVKKSKRVAWENDSLQNLLRDDPVVASSKNNKNNNNKNTASAAAAASSSSSTTTTTEQQEPQKQEQEEIDESLILSPEESIELFQSEIESITAVFSEENVIVEEPSSSSSSSSSEKKVSNIMTVKVQVLSPTDIEEVFEKRHLRSKGLWIQFIKPVLYPAKPLEPFLEPWSHNCFSFGETDAIYKAMVGVALAEPGAPCLFNMTQAAATAASTIIAEGGVMVDEKQRNSISEAMRAAGMLVRLPEEKLNPAVYCGSVSSWCSKLPPGYDVFLIENVCRRDLALRFETFQHFLFEKYIKNKLARSGNKLENDPALAKLADTRVTFHGSRMVLLDSIVATGVAVPGISKDVNGKIVDVRVGQRYGRGAYSATQPDFALHYAESGRTNEYSVKLLVCAVLPGKCKMITDDDMDEYYEKYYPHCWKGYDSHCCEYDEQIAVFHPAQILPCYVIHLMQRKSRGIFSGNEDVCLDKASQLKKEMKELEEEHEEAKKSAGIKGTSGVKGASASKALQRATQALDSQKKKLLTAMARKNLPYGFGAAGGAFVVEEIAEVDDDDEDCDEYVQATHDNVLYDEFQHAV